MLLVLNLQLYAQPVITNQPVNQTVVLGGNATFSVTATGAGPFTYQWLFNGTNLPNGIITTVAGNGIASYSGDGGVATNASLQHPTDVKLDAYGNLYIADYGNVCIREVNTNGIITTIYTNVFGLSGNQNVYAPGVIVIDAYSNLFFSIPRLNAVIKMATNGTIQSVAGHIPGVGYSGDGGAATNAALNSPIGVAMDAFGNLFIADQLNNRIRKVNTNGIITTVAGNGMNHFTGDGGAATNAGITSPMNVTVDAYGNIFFSDTAYSTHENRIRKVDTNGIITTVAGNGGAILGDGGAATNASLNGPNGVTMDAFGNLFIADSGNGRIRKVDTNGIITTVAGNGNYGYSGDGGAATNASLAIPFGITVDAYGNLYIADTYNASIRKVTYQGPTLPVFNVAPTNAGNYQVIVTGAYGSVTSSVATLTVLLPPTITSQPVSQSIVYGQTAAFSVTAAGAGPFTYQWLFNGTNLPNGIITSVAGNGANGFSGDGGAATNAALKYPSRVAVDSYGNLFIADWLNRRIREVNTNGIITTVAGTNNEGFSGDGGAATNASLADPYAVTVDAYGNLFIADSDNLRIREVNTNGIITTVAGTGKNGFSGDGGAATNASLGSLEGVAVDAYGNLFFADGNNNRIREVNTNGIITTVAGTNSSGFSGDGGAATNAALNFPLDVTVDGYGNLFIVDNNRIREVNTNGIITTVAGNGTIGGLLGDGGAATNATVNPFGVAVDVYGNLFIADEANNRIREIRTNGIITTVAGKAGGSNYSGDGGAATNASLAFPSGVALDAYGNLFIADTSNQRIRKVILQGATLPVFNVAPTNAGNYQVIVTGTYGSVTSSVVALNVVLPPITPSFASGNGTFNLSWSAVSNVTYQLQYNLDLSTTNWINLGSPITATNNSVSTTDMTGSDVQRFYRVLLVQ
jgi:sugar lactone lactonase YvrE